MSCLTYAQAEELTEATSNNVLPTIKLEAQGNWLRRCQCRESAKACRRSYDYYSHRLDEVAATSIKDALKQVPGVQVQENNGTGGSDVSLNIGVPGLASVYLLAHSTA